MVRLGRLVLCYRECDSVVVVGKLLWFQYFGNAFEGIERLVVVRVHRVGEYRVVYHHHDLVSERHDNDVA
jgi:hypothetical protein